MLKLSIDDKSYVVEPSHGTVLVMSLISDYKDSSESTYNLSICAINARSNSDHREISIWADSTLSDKSKLTIEVIKEPSPDQVKSLPLRIAEHKDSGKRSVLQLNSDNVGPIKSIEDILNHLGS